MKIGSKIILAMDPATVPIIASIAKPSVRIKLPGVKDKIMIGAPNVI